MVIMRRRWILFAGFVARMKDTRLPKCVMFEELVRTRAAWGSKEEGGLSVFGRPQSFRYQRRPVDDSSPG